MPYIPKKDKPRLDPLIENLRAKAAALVVNAGYPFFAGWRAYCGYIARRVLVETALNAAEQYQGKRGTRYWLIVDHAGIAFNIACELYRRVLVRRTDGGKREFDFIPFGSNVMNAVPHGANELNPEIDALVSEIAKISGPDGYNYDGAYCGMDNYSLTELMPRVLLSILDSGNYSLEWPDIKDMIRFWLTVSRDLYMDIASQYEDEQIAKPENGDIQIYQMLLERLKK